MRCRPELHRKDRPRGGFFRLLCKREQMVADQIGKRYGSILKSKPKSPEEFAAVYSKLEDLVGPEAAQQLLIKFKITHLVLAQAPHGQQARTALHSHQPCLRQLDARRPLVTAYRIPWFNER